MAIGSVGHLSAAGCSLYQPLLEKEGLDHILNGVSRFGKAGGKGVDPDRPAAEMRHDDFQIASVKHFKAKLIDIETTKRLSCHLLSDGKRPFHRGNIPYTA